MSVPSLPIVVDTREQNPWPLEGFVSIIKGLPTGDYSILGHESLVCIERKSKVDAWGSLGGKGGTRRRRLEDEFKRMAEMKKALVIIECNLDEFVVPPQHTKLNVSSVVGTYESWMVKYGVPVQWVPNRIFAERLAIRFLGAYLKYRVREDVV